MSTSLLDKKIDKRVETIVGYAKTILSKVYKLDIGDLKIMEACIHRYINGFEIGNDDTKTIEIENKEFFDTNGIKTEIHKRVFMKLLDQLSEMDKPPEDKSIVDNIALLSEALAIAYEIEQYTKNFEQDVGYKQMLIDIKQRYQPFVEPKVDSNLKLSNIKLKENVISNIKYEKDLKELENRNPFYLEFYCARGQGRSPNDIVYVNLRDGTRELEKFSSKKVKAVNSKKQILYEQTNIKIEMIAQKVLEILIKKKKYEMFIIRLPDGYLLNNRNKMMILNLTNQKLVKEKICFEIGIDEGEKSLDTILKIKDSGYKIAIDVMESSNNLTDQVKQLADCLVVPPELIEELGRDPTKQSEYGDLLLLDRDIGFKDVILEL